MAQLRPVSDAHHLGEEKRGSVSGGAPRRSLLQSMQQPEHLEELPAQVISDRTNQAQKRLDMLSEVNRRLNRALVDKKVLAERLRTSNTAMTDRLQCRSVEGPARSQQISELQEKLQGEQSHQQTGTLEMSKKVLLLEEKIAALSTVNAELQERHRADRALIAEQQAAVKQKSKQARELTRHIEFMEGATYDRGDTMSVVSDASEMLPDGGRRWSVDSRESPGHGAQVGQASALLKKGKGTGPLATIDDYRRLPGLNLKRLLGEGGESKKLKEPGTGNVKGPGSTSGKSESPRAASPAPH